MRNALRAAFALTLLPTALAAQLAQVSGDVVISANQGDATVHVIDAESGRQLGRFTGFAGPHEVAVSADGRWAVVTDYGDGPNPGRRLAVIDISRFELTRWIDLGEYRRPHDIHFLPDNRTLAVTVEANQAVLLVDFESGKVVKAVPTKQRGSHMVAITADGARMFSANIPDGSISELDAKRGEHVRVVPVAPQDEGIAVTPDGSQLWVASLANQNVTVVDTKTWEKIATLPAQGHPYRVTISRDGKRAFVPTPMADVIHVFDIATRQARSIAVPGGPGRIAISADGKRAYMPLMGPSQIGVLDLETLEIVKRLETGVKPDGVGVSSYYRK